MDDATPSTRRKALALNLDPVTYGVVAEAGGGQEVARWFFEVGGAAGTVDKTISAYDMAMGDALYGPTQRYVSRQRLEAMLEREFSQLTEQLGPRRGDATAFFAHHLRDLLLEIGRIEPIRHYDEEYLSIRTPDVLARIEAGNESSDAMVPTVVAATIRTKALFGYRTIKMGTA